VDVLPVRVPVADLHFDRHNPRLLEHIDDETELLNVMWREFVVNEVAISIAANGFWPYEPLLACREDERYVVIEGNRRLAAVKLLLDSEARAAAGATDLPVISEARRQELQELPIIITTRVDAWQFVGFKHVNGPQSWQAYSKAQYVAWVHNNVGVPLDKIAQTIGDQHSTVQRLYRGLMVLEQAEKEGLWDRSDRAKGRFPFSHLYIGLSSYAGIQKHLGLNGPPADRPDPISKRFFPQLGELMVWLFGSKSLGALPVVQSQNPHLRQLDRVLANRNATAAIRSGMPLTVALDVAKGDTAKLREDLVGARRLLQDCRGKVLTGFQGDPELLDLADEVLLLAEAIVDDMRAAQKRLRARKRADTENEG